MAFTPDQTTPDSGSSALEPQSRLIPAFASPNAQIADKLRQAADILPAQGAEV